MSTQIQALPDRAAMRRLSVTLRPRARYITGILALALAYYGAAKAGQALSYTGSVSAIWPPAGLGIAVLYLWGLRWWPGVFLGALEQCLQSQGAKITPGAGVAAASRML